jgi:hypothetical protein
MVSTYIPIRLTAAEELKHNIPPTVILYSLVSTYTTKKLKQILLTTNIIHPEFNWTEESHTNHWDCTLNIETINSFIL